MVNSAKRFAHGQSVLPEPISLGDTMTRLKISPIDAVRRCLPQGQGCHAGRAAADWLSFRVDP
ncbi:hypothetical protein N826_35440 [Skermanella aerolata KACC 11604]|nr:hypothetical protein N826_35440 [Skermanella aerolata KACC 11604]